jgi:hypothetical protein
LCSQQCESGLNVHFTKKVAICFMGEESMVVQ